MAEGALHDETMFDALERHKESVQAQALRFPRAGFYIAVSILAWVAFWTVVEQNQHVPHTQTLAWTCVAVAVWVAYTY